MSRESALSSKTLDANWKLISDSPLRPEELLAQARNPASGALVLFSGEARNHNRGRPVLGLEYEVYKPMAEKHIRRIVADALERWELNFAACVHRAGRTEVLESAVVVVTSSAHRSEAYEANRYIIDRVKHEVPIWKKELYADGESVWSENCENCSHPSHTSP